MAKQSFRIKFMFWLDSTKPDEARLMEQVELLKGDRLFSKTIRDGIRLICDLRAGRTEVLFELFPWVRDGLQSAPVTTDDRLQAQIARLEALLLAQGNVPIKTPLAQRPRSRELNVTTRKQHVQAELGSTVGKASAETVAKNFLSSMKGLASGFFD